MIFFWLFFWIIVLVVIFGFLFYYLSIEKSRLKRQKEVNEKAFANLNYSDFKINKIFYLNDNASYKKSNIEKQIICANIERKKLVLFDYDAGSITIVDFSDILDYQIYKNGSTVTLGGKAGGFFALFGAESSAKCKELRLMIKLKRYDKSQVSYHIIKDTMLGAGIEEGCDCFKECISSMQEVVAFLEVIKEENKQ